MSPVLQLEMALLWFTVDSITLVPVTLFERARSDLEQLPGKYDEFLRVNWLSTKIQDSCHTSV